MDFKGLSKGGGLMVTCFVVLAVSILLQSTTGLLRIVVLVGGLVAVFLLFSFVLSRE